MKKVKLEDSLKRLSEIVKKLEQNDGELEEALGLFEEGIKLTRSCHEELSKAERRIEVLTKVSGEQVESKPLE